MFSESFWLSEPAFLSSFCFKPLVYRRPFWQLFSSPWPPNPRPAAHACGCVSAAPSSIGHLLVSTNMSSVGRLFLGNNGIPFGSLLPHWLSWPNMFAIHGFVLRRNSGNGTLDHGLLAIHSLGSCSNKIVICWTGFTRVQQHPFRILYWKWTAPVLEACCSLPWSMDFSAPHACPTRLCFTTSCPREYHSINDMRLSRCYAAPVSSWVPVLLLLVTTRFFYI